VDGRMNMIRSSDLIEIEFIAFNQDKDLYGTKSLTRWCASWWSFAMDESRNTTNRFWITGFDNLQGRAVCLARLMK
jgi:hypothetical protein